jgi:putative transposase
VSFSLESLYRSVGTLKQNVHGYISRLYSRKCLEEQILIMVFKIREDHPDMGVRGIYFMIAPIGLGRDVFERLCRTEGLNIRVYRNGYKTTDSSGTRYFPNLIEGLELKHPNQVWQSDITFFSINGRFLYITLIQDAFTKIVVGHCASGCLETESTTIIALKLAIKRYKGKNLEGLIFHSDGGGQYYSNLFLKITAKHEIKSSMGKSCYENAMAESLNGVIKNKYLRFRNINSLTDLSRELDHTVQLYNSSKPHSALGRMTPEMFEKKWLNSMSQTEAKMTESVDATKMVGHRAPSF